MEAQKILRTNITQQSEMTLQLFNSLLPKYNNDRLITYIVFERLIIETGAPQNEDQRVGREIGKLLNEMSTIMQQFVPSERANVQEYFTIMRGIVVEYDEFCHSLVRGDF